jgi:hypothetical protein
VFVGGQSGEGVLSDSGLSLVGGPNYPVQSKCQSLFRSRSAPTVARGSSSSRTPSPSFPLASLTARNVCLKSPDESASRAVPARARRRVLPSHPDQPHARSRARGATRRRLHRPAISHFRCRTLCAASKPRDEPMRCLRPVSGRRGCPRRRRPTSDSRCDDAISKAQRRLVWH